jgi:hypothetical protein
MDGRLSVNHLIFTLNKDRIVLNKKEMERNGTHQKLKNKRPQNQQSRNKAS